MFHDFCDFDHDTIINYISSQTKGLHGMEKINRIFLDVKNNMYYDGRTPMQKASETLVMGRGNNVDKTILLYTLLRAGGF
jgi:transglutaminase-like putative cysteine protease